MRVKNWWKPLPSPFVKVAAAAGITAVAGAIFLLSGNPSSRASSSPSGPAVPAVSPGDHKSAFELAATAAGFAAGSPGATNVAYVFFDPQCPHCGTMWKNSKALLSRTQLVWIPVALLSKTSASQGAFILSSVDPVATMDKHEESLSARLGGVSVVGEDVSPAARAQMERNTEIFAALGARSVPYVVYKNAKTGVFGANPGAMPAELLGALMGLPAPGLGPRAR